jgi:hypothetical protein
VLACGLACGLSKEGTARSVTSTGGDIQRILNEISPTGELLRNSRPIIVPMRGGDRWRDSANSAYTVSFTTDPTNARLRVVNDYVIFDLNGHTYTLTTTSTSSPSIMVGEFSNLTVKTGVAALNGSLPL